jgi:hypothetical protein
VNIGDKLPALRLPNRGGRRDPAEEERLLKLFWNRAELKKELANLDAQLQQLRERLKQQEGATARLADEFESLETLLGAPELGFGALAHYTLRALWRACRQQLEQFSSELKRQQEDKERKRQLVEFHQDRQQRLKVAEERLAAAEAELEAAAERLRVVEAQLASLLRFWHHFRRRDARSAVADARVAMARADVILEDLKEARRTIEKEPWPEFPGLGLEGRRTINLAIIAYAQLLYMRLSELGLALQTRIAQQKAVQEVRYGGRSECTVMIDEIAAATAMVREARDLAADIRSRTESLRGRVTYRHTQDTVPDPGSLPANSGGGTVAIREPNVLLEDYWDLYKVLLR